MLQLTPDRPVQQYISKEQPRFAAINNVTACRRRGIFGWLAASLSVEAAAWALAGLGATLGFPFHFRSQGIVTWSNLFVTIDFGAWR